MRPTQKSDWSSESFQNPQEQKSINNDSSQSRNNSSVQNNDPTRQTNQTNISLSRSFIYGLLAGSLLAGVVLAVVVTIWQTEISKTTSSNTSTTTATTATTTTATTATTITTTTVNPCSILRWNKTGIAVAGTGSPGTASNQLSSPHGLYIDSSDTLYICDYGNNRVQKWTLGASNGSTVAGDSNGNRGSSNTFLNSPADLTFDKNGYMYVVDQDNHRVQRYAPNSAIGTTVAGNGNMGSANTQFNNPSGIAIDENFNLYITDRDNQRIMKWAANATNGTVFVSSSNLSKPYGIIFKNGSSNQIYVSDYSNDVVQLWYFGSSQSNKTVAGVSSGDLNYPMAIKLDPYGNLYVANRLGRDVRKFCSTSTTPVTVVGNSTTGSGLVYPAGIAFDSNYNLYVADTNRSQVMKFTRL